MELDELLAEDDGIEGSVDYSSQEDAFLVYEGREIDSFARESYEALSTKERPVIFHNMPPSTGLPNCWEIPATAHCLPTLGVARGYLKFTPRAEAAFESLEERSAPGKEDDEIQGKPDAGPDEISAILDFSDF